MENTCFKCQSDPDKKPGEQWLHKCPVCHNYFCDEHAALVSGRRFCSPGCADYFFYEDPDD